MDKKEKNISNTKHLLVVDDDQRIRDLLKEYLIKEGFIISTADCAEDAREKMRYINYDLIILDVMMPGDDGLKFTSEIRINSQTPIILLTAKSEIDSKIEGLETGADDYITKPFSPKELVLRINSILKRSKDNKILNPEIFFGDYILNIETRDFTKSGTRVYLTERELNLLILLAESPGKPLSREDLAGIDEPGRAVDVGINRLRKKIEDNPTMPIWLQTVRGKGYILRPN
ncbi:response regulator transcription factor [Hyphomicrobiales bacterium]|jgi:two-component system phosphate regulon response regulator OmpR|nr:response regulator transcription factor [Hyphomicrobiales bacterium]MDA9904606.1 response regulator transcription factor [Hyphomicrobiales bacterium]|tara:strand:- start:623 stop:1315 length:693 start_codon:yes stop_codon:yes gene_type:complete